MGKTVKDPSLKMLSTALKMEERGKRMYEKWVGKAKSAFVREIFEMLAKDELTHMRRIRAIYESLESGKGWTKDWKSLKFEHGDLKKLFTKLVKKHSSEVESSASELKAVSLGVELEHSSIKYYSEKLEKASDKSERAFLEKMLEEEKGHLSALLDLKMFLEDPADWHMKKERHLPS